VGAVYKRHLLVVKAGGTVLKFQKPSSFTQLSTPLSVVKIIKGVCFEHALLVTCPSQTYWFVDDINQLV
jgi:hypothetical protein